MLASIKTYQDVVYDPLGNWSYQFIKPQEKRQLGLQLCQGKNAQVIQPMVVRMLETPAAEDACDLLADFFSQQTDERLLQSMVAHLARHEQPLPKDLYLIMQNRNLTHQASEKVYLPESKTHAFIQSAAEQTQVIAPHDSRDTLNLQFTDHMDENVLNHLGLSKADISGAWVKKGNKSGGMRPSGEIGGIYRTKQGRDVLVKADDKEEHNLAEFVGSYLHRAIVGKTAVQVIPIPVKEKTYLGSYFLDNFQDLFKYAYQSQGLKTPDNRPRLCTDLRVKKIYDKVLGLAQGKGLETALMSSLLLGDFDMHWGNLGVITNPKNGQLERVERIDFGWAFLGSEFASIKIGTSFGETLSPESIFNHLPGTGPTNHWRSVPEDLKTSKLMIDEAVRISQIDLNDAIEQALRQAAKFWSLHEKAKVWYKFTSRANLYPKDNGLDTIITAIQSKIRTRQVMLKNYAIELLVRGVGWDGNEPYLGASQLSIADLKKYFCYDNDRLALESLAHDASPLCFRAKRLLTKLR